MAVTDIRDLKGGLTGGINSDFERQYTRTLHLDCGPGDGPVLILGALASAGFTVGSAYTWGSESDTGVILNDIALRPHSQAEDGLTWEAVLSYGKPPSREARASSDPFEWLPEVEVTFREYERPVERDTAGDLIVNSAGDPFNPTLVRDDSRMILRITRNEATEPYAVMRAIKNTVNELTWLGLPPRTAKALAPRCTIEWHQNVSGFRYWKVAYEFEINDEVYYADDGTTVIGQGWDQVVLDAGFRQLISGERSVITIDGQPPNEPVPLNGAGLLLPVDDPPQYLVFKVYPEVDYGSVLGITSI